jgi:hypothetical protein
MTVRLFALVFLILTTETTYAQLELGMRLESRAGSYALALNPAWAGHNPARWDVQLGQFDIFGQQSYGFIQNSSIPHLYRNLENIGSVADYDPEDPIPSSVVLQDFYGAEKGKAYGVFQTRVSGPGFTARIGESHTIGLMSAVRAHASCYRLPLELRYQPSLDQVYGRPIFNDSERVEGMGWAEVGLPYGYQNRDADIYWSVAVTPKYLMGIQAGYVRVVEPFEYTRINNDTIRFDSGDWEYAFTNDILYGIDPANPTAAPPSPQINGRGFGVDLGAAWAMPDDNDKGYLWRFGVSLMDIGAIRYNRNAELHRIRFDSVIIAAEAPLTASPDAQAFVGEFSRTFLGDPVQSLKGNSFQMGLPMALSIQGEVAITPRTYVAAVWTQRMPLGPRTLRRASTIAVVPRWEHAWASVSVPVLLNDYNSLQMGFAARLGWLTFGTDDLLTWTTRRDLRGGNAYVGLKINGFTLKRGDRNSHYRKRHRSGGRQWNGRRLREKDRHWKDVGCFQF